MHADKNNPGMVKGMGMLGRTMDQAVSTFLEDLGDRGLSEKILLVIERQGEKKEFTIKPGQLGVSIAALYLAPVFE